MKVYKGTLDEIECPPILYKYRDWEKENDRRWIFDKEVYMSSPLKFEDELDCKIPIKYELMSSKQALKFYERLLKFENPNYNRQKIREEAKAWEKRKNIKV